MKRIFKSGLFLIALGTIFSCGRDYETVDAAFKDTLKVNDVPNKELQEKDPANLVDTKPSAPGAAESDTKKADAQASESVSDSSDKK
ncbi:MAG: hypothetical protein J7604_05605 [Sporocytophaga sp.]|uniref:hypothetical protein n=1 Tax=Sporocytophaga sp. TaxID=2231183 RepID=UPI001B2A78DA|nr:hypothetical protein [Sporocytophaga sp.]MBO9699666.1 hypothetical protein [Sporocytophaga sp.]